MSSPLPGPLPTNDAIEWTGQRYGLKPYLEAPAGFETAGADEVAAIAPALVDALVDLSALQGRQLAGIALLADTCLSGLTGTTLAYQSGMQDMAIEQQRQLLKHADVLGDPAPPPHVRPPHRTPQGP